jgi:hypothetical protein
VTLRTSIQWPDIDWLISEGETILVPGEVSGRAELEDLAENRPGSLAARYPIPPATTTTATIIAIIEFFTIGTVNTSIKTFLKFKNLFRLFNNGFQERDISCISKQKDSDFLFYMNYYVKYFTTSCEY